MILLGTEVKPVTVAKDLGVHIDCHIDCHILISFVFPQFTSFHSVFHSFHGLMNSINWPASSVWVFIAQAGRALQR